MTVLLLTQAAGADATLTPSTPIIVAAGGLLVANADAPADILADLTAHLEDATGTIIVTAANVAIAFDSDLGGDVWRYAARLTAPAVAASYRIVWQAAEPGQTAAEPVVVEIGVRPSIESVAALLRARTKIRGGTEIGTFNSLTRPTAAQVEELIDEALDDVLGKVQPVDETAPAWRQQGDTYNAPGSPYERRIRRATALYAAILVELSYFPEQVRNNQSPVATYQQLYESRIRALIAEGETGRPEGEGSGGPGGGDAPADAAYSFPDAAPGALVGWGSRW